MLDVCINNAEAPEDRVPFTLSLNTHANTHSRGVSCFVHRPHCFIISITSHNALRPDLLEIAVNPVGVETKL